MTRTRTRTRGPRTALALTATAVLAATGCTPDAGERQEPGEREGPVSLETDERVAALVPGEVRDSGVLVIGTHPPYAPNEFRDDRGEIVGFDIDVMTAAAQLMGLEPEFRQSEFDEIIPNVAQGSLDTGASSITVTEKRLETVDSVTYFEAGLRWVSAAGTEVDPDHACGLSVAVQRATVSAEEGIPARSTACTYAGEPPIETVRFDSQDEATAAVALGKVDAMSADSPVAAYAVDRSQGKLQLVGEVFDAAPYGWPVREDSGLAAALEAAADTLIETGDLETMAEDWGVEDGLIDDAEVRRGADDVDVRQD